MIYVRPTGQLSATIPQSLSSIGNSIASVIVSNPITNFNSLQFSAVAEIVSIPSIERSLNSFSVGTSPNGIAIDASGNIWVTNFGSGTVTKLSPVGSVLGVYNVGGGPRGIAIDPSTGNVWVACWDSNSVYVLSPSGASVGNYPCGSQPVGIAIDAFGNVWVANYNTVYTVTKMNLSGAILDQYSIGIYPCDITTDSLGFIWLIGNFTGNIYRLDSSGNIKASGTVYSCAHVKTDSSGNAWITQYGATGIVYELNQSCSVIGTFSTGSPAFGIGFDKSGGVWVTHSSGVGGNNSVTNLSSTGNIVGTYPVGNSPSAVAVDNTGNVWVTSQGDNKVVQMVGYFSSVTFMPIITLVNSNQQSPDLSKGIGIFVNGNYGVVFVWNGLNGTYTTPDNTIVAGTRYMFTVVVNPNGQISYSVSTADGLTSIASYSIPNSSYAAPVLFFPMYACIGDYFLNAGFGDIVVSRIIINSDRFLMDSDAYMDCNSAMSSNIFFDFVSLAGSQIITDDVFKNLLKKFNAVKPIYVRQSQLSIVISFSQGAYIFPRFDAFPIDTGYADPSWELFSGGGPADRMGNVVVNSIGIT
jgi:DNA-binding beta-propeller fold protein YncE